MSEENVTRLVNPYALQKRARKIIDDIDKFFQDADEFGISYKEADPNEQLLKIRKACVDMLDNERKIGRLKP